jgi:hypothetical protein
VTDVGVGPDGSLSSFMNVAFSDVGLIPGAFAQVSQSPKCFSDRLGVAVDGNRSAPHLFVRTITLVRWTVASRLRHLSQIIGSRFIYFAER